MTKPISKDWIHPYLEHGLDVANRRIFLTDHVEDDLINKIIRGIYLMETKSDSKPIELFVSSYGGDIFAMFGLYDVLRTINCPVNTIAFGKCMSAAVLLVAAGTVGERYATPNCAFMVHDFSADDMTGKIEYIKNDLKNLEYWRDKWAELMASHTKQPKKFWLKMCNRSGDHFFTSQQAVDYGVVDIIWDQKESS